MIDVSIFTEIFVACSLFTCGTEAAKELTSEKPPPIEYTDASADVLYSDAKETCSTFIDEAEASKQRIINRLEDELVEVSELNEDLNANNSELSDELAETKRKLKELQSAYDNANNRRNSSDSSDGNARSNDANVGKAVASDEHYGMEFNTSYYGMDCVGCSGITASGLDVSDGSTTYKGMRILAADTSILPLHTIVIITNPDGSSYKGIVKDRGGAIKGYKLDVLVGSEAEASVYGRHSAKLEIVSKGDNKYRKE